MPPDSLVLVSPAVESLLTSDNDTMWPENIKNNKKLREQAEDRLCLHEAFTTLFTRVANTQKITDAIDTGTVSAENATAAYQELADFLEKDLCHARIVLYLPFEILPHRLWRHTSHALEEATRRFVDIYIKRWNELLSVHDVRANFVDGDVWELELRTAPLERVVKAAHLIPQLAAGGLLSVQHIFDLIEESPGSVLQKSVLDTVPVLADMGLLSADDAKNILASHGAHGDTPQVTLPTITQERARWLKQEEDKKLVEKRAGDIANKILCGLLSPQRVKESGHETLAIIHGIRIAVETLAYNDLEKAKAKYLGYENVLRLLWERRTPEITDALTGTWSRLRALHIVDLGYEEQFGIEIINLDAPFAERKKSIEREMKKFDTVIGRIEKNSRLSRLLYPVCILFGSRLKGYGTSTADLDVAVLVRPEISIEERQTLQKLLKQLLSDERAKGRAVEFWLEKRHGELAVRDFPRPDVLLGDSSLVHVLFGGAWYGKEQSIRELYAKLLSGYLYSENKNTRRMWREELERDALQYRLMHKGYARFFPAEGGIHTEHAHRIDGSSMFYDSGYRRLATKLFITKVFLPQLEK